MKTPDIKALFRHRQAVSTLRLWIQTAFLVFILWTGYRFFLFYSWAIGKSDIFIDRPPSVEGFLPISALLGVKRLLHTGAWDQVHPAGLAILLLAVLIAVILRKGFCGWICPVGAVSNLVERITRKLKMFFRLPVWFDLPLLSLKYLLLVFFLYAIFLKMNLRQTIAFQETPYNIAADAKMLHFFIDPSRLTLQVMTVLVVLSVFFRNFWCRYLCPYGALLGLVAMFSPTQVHRDKNVCIDCKKCEKVCPGSIIITDKDTVRSAECIGCLECVSICPKNDCLTVRTSCLGTIRPVLIPLLVVGVFLAGWGIANLTGHWQSHISLESFQKAYQARSTLSHPPM